LRIGRRRIPVVPPSIHDPRLHLSSVILTIIVVGVGWLGFSLSIPQIAVTMLVCAVMELAWTYRRTSMLVWPASALQTATSVSLLFRVIGTDNSDLWTFHGWYLFAAIGAFSLLTKYTIRFPGGGHVFNPSNIGLIVGFLVLGSQRVEPLDYWWAPLGVAMVAAYAVIFCGGFWICAPLRLLGLGLSFWLSLAAGIAVLAAMGHSITTRWSFTPIEDWHFWWIVLTSPEIFIFLFFMITDPKTVPAGRVARVVFGALMGLVCTILIAPWGTEFGAKVGLLSGLAVLCATRPLLERRMPAPGAADDDLAMYVARVVRGERAGAGWLAVRAAAGVGGVAVAGIAIVAAGLPARHPTLYDPQPVAAPAIVEIDPASLPPVSIDPVVAGLSATLATPDGAQDLAETLAWNLQVEAEALVTGDPSLLPAVDDGERLDDLEAAIAAADTSGERVVPTYHFDSLHLVVVFPGGLQRGANAGLVAEGMMSEVVHTADGAQLTRPERPFSMTFSLRPTTDGRWLTTDTLPPAP
jgi:hypothetical protein